MLSRKPYLTVKIENKSIPCLVYFNGGFVTVDSTHTVADETWPVNPLARSGENELAILVFPTEGLPSGFSPDAAVTVKLLVQEFGKPDRQHEIATLSFSGAQAGSSAALAASSAAGEFDSTNGMVSVRHGDVIVGSPSVRPLTADGLLVVRRTVSMPLPFPEWAFFRSDSATPAYELNMETGLKPYNDLLDAYEKIWTLLKRRDLDRLLPMFEERSREMDQALYETPGTTQAKLRAAFEEALNNTARELRPIRPPEDDFWIYQVGLTGKMLRLSRDDLGGTILRFADKQHPTFATIFPIVFRKQGDEFIVTR